MTKFTIKTGDEVIVITGKNKGKKGKVVQALPRLNRVVVEGVNMMKRHMRSRRAEDKGQVIEFSMPIHISNVQPVGSNGKPTRHNKARKTA